MSAVLNAAAFLKDTRTVGPGVRDALWVQGCTIGCPGCGNQAFLPHVARRALPVEALLRHVERRQGQIDGLSVLGGEPTEQTAAVATLLEGVQALGLSVVVFTGQLYEDLLAEDDPSIHRLLAATDLLIDGPFVLAERDPRLRWRGSRNQRLLCLTPRLRDCLPASEVPASEVIVNEDGILFNGVARMHLRRMPQRGESNGNTSSV